MPEFPDRPYVRDIHEAQRRGFPIFDTTAYEIYRAALTSHVGLSDNPAVNDVLHPLAQQARQWLQQHPHTPVVD
ncbi:hypothetical protein [Planosporangium mesophilum]|nr:hypothetical protein [Planosporangium mesophilum]NJC85498.1 hypothetical protein [Planosporangium mesophilum]